MNEFEVHEIRDVESVYRLAPEWEALWRKDPSATPFQHPHWLMGWIEAFRPAELRVYVARKSGRLAGVAPMYVQLKRPRVLAPIGTAVSDYIDWLLDGEVGTHELAEALLAHMLESESDCLLDVGDIPENSALLRIQSGMDRESSTKQHDVCPALELTGDMKSIVPRQQMRSLKTARRDLQKLGAVESATAGAENVDEFLEALFALHGARWSERGGEGVLADNDVRRFHRVVVPKLRAQNMLRLYGLRFDGKLIAVLYALHSSEVTYCYLQGFDPEFRDFSPGAQLVGAVIEEAIGEGKKAVDFLRGGEKYKYAWGARDRATFRLQISPKAVHLPTRAA
ncbi:MAG TPA: GNAT family N-acetyltransferase [Terriglobales bacterium]|nr:GNAT family N-acetyltransferase [Terriglobales bacterium]